MRYRDLFDPKAWRKYEGRDRRCLMSSMHGSAPQEVEVLAQFGHVRTGKQRVWAGYFVQVIDPSGPTWIAEHPHSLRGALREVGDKLEADGWSLKVIGLSSDWRETGLSENSGFGYHPGFDKAVHMLSPMPLDALL